MRHVIVGGGIAGVCCVDELCRLRPDDEVVLVSASTLLKGVANVTRITRNVEEFQVVERDLNSLEYPNARVVQAAVVKMSAGERSLDLSTGDVLTYDTLCICSGARPKRLAEHEHVVVLRDTHSVQDLCERLRGATRVVLAGNGGIALELISALRDVEVVWVLKHSHIGEAFFDRDAASFLLRELAAAQACERRQQQHQTLRAEEEEEKEESAWADSSGAGAACQPSRQAAGASGGGRSASPTSGPMGHAVGPKWTERLQEQQRQVGRGGTPARVTLEYNALVTHVVAGDSGTGATAETTPEGDAPAARPQHPAGDEASEEAPTAAAPSAPSSAGSPNGRPWPVTVHLSSGALIGADFVVSAIGVEPCTEWVAPEVQRAPDGGLWVDARMATTSCGVYAAGDACTVRPEAVGPHWFQMRLWTQARVMGTHAARCIAGRADDLGSGFAFELFTHVTRFFGKKVVLLGLYNGQRLEKEAAGDIVMYSRDEPPEGFDSGGSGSGAAVARHRAGGGGGCCGSGGGAQDASVNSFVRVLLLRGRLQGAVLIGETDLEETLENLILDGLDLSGYGPHLLDPDVELDHVFD